MRHYWRKFIRLFHPEGIPRVASSLYNLLSKSNIFQEHYDLVTKDIQKYCQNGKLLDIGTGPGWLLMSIHKIMPRLILTGIDISPAMVEKAKINIRNSGCAMEVIVGSATDLPYPDNSFDCVVSTGSIHHWKDIQKGLVEIYRVLKPGSYTLIYDLIQELPPDIEERAINEFGRFKMMLLWLHTFEEPFYSVDEMIALPATTPFIEGEVHFAGVFCCLVLKKG
jgi:ubiquinone/menaquinone biosynthesis C-methylase UbiE